MLPLAFSKESEVQLQVQQINSYWDNKLKVYKTVKRQNTKWNTEE